MKSPPLPRFTKVIFTIGPETVDVDVLRRMIRKGVDVCRINMAHASHDWTLKAVAAVREASEAEGVGVSLLLDIKGPEVRTGHVDTPVGLAKGQLIDCLLYTSDAADE